MRLALTLSLALLVGLLRVTGACLLPAPPQASQQPDGDSLELWYRQPAVKWTDALPIGNGHIGAMIFGGADTAHIQFNEASLWTGRPRNYAHPGAAAYLPKIRQLIFSGQQAAAEALAEAHFMGIKNHDPATYRVFRQRWLDSVRLDTAAAAYGYNDRDWKTMQLPLLNGWETGGLQGVDGALWFRVAFDVPEQWKGKDLYVDLGRIRDQDYCYLNGHYVGRDSGISEKRHYLLRAKDLRAGRNILAIQVINFFDKGGFTGVKNDRKIFVLYPADQTPAEGVAISRSWKYRIQNRQPPPYPQYEASYQPFGDILITGFSNNGPGQTAPVRNYRRSLNLRDAVASVSYGQGDKLFGRTYWASAADPVLAIRLSAGRPGALQFKAAFATDHVRHHLYKVDDHTIGMRVQVKDGALYGVAELRVQTQGKKATVRVEDGAVTIKEADRATLYLVAATNFKSYKDVSGDPAALCRQHLAALKGQTPDQLEQRHLDVYRRRFRSFDLFLGRHQRLSVPTDQRIRQYTPASDPGLLALYTQYARYLMLSASPPDGRAANLQGIWNDLLTPPWGSKYTTNINLEMNYWPAELLHLSACTRPLFRLIQAVSETGHTTAEEQYGAPGWIEHHNTDIWAGTAPIDAATHGVWVGGAAWLCHHLWEHFLFTRDTAFLRSQGYPLMKKAALFYSHFLVPDPATGLLVSCPSNSPEHGGLVAGPTMDHQLIRDLFSNCMEAETVLHTDQGLHQELARKYARIAPNRIGRLGQLQEWLTDIDDSTDTHRHVSHLWGVYPGTDISWDKDTAMMRAARRSVELRGDDGTGWSLAWKVNLWARFKDGNHALRLLGELLRPAEGGKGQERGGVYHNMMDAHPPFQIDGNFGAAAGVAEMLLQSQNGYIELLPALPDALPRGAVRGICARGDFSLDFSWTDGKLKKLTVYAGKDGRCSLRCQGKAYHWEAKAGHHYTLDGQLHML